MVCAEALRSRRTRRNWSLARSTVVRLWLPVGFIRSNRDPFQINTHHRGTEKLKFLNPLAVLWRSREINYKSMPPNSSSRFLPDSVSPWWISCFRLRPGMMLLIHGLQPIEGQVRVDLGGRNVGVAEDCLHRAKVGPIFDHMARTGMPQHVRRGRSAGCYRW